VVEAENGDDREDDGTEKYLGDVIVEDLLIGVRGVSVLIVFGCCFVSGAEVFGSIEYVLG